MERSIMIQYTGTSSQSNYNDERTATIGLATTRLPRRLGVGFERSFAPVHLLSPSSTTPSLSAAVAALFLVLVIPPCLSFRLSFYRRHVSVSSTLSRFVRLGSLTPLSLTERRPLRCCARTATRANIHHGVVTGPRSHGGWILSLIHI